MKPVDVRDKDRKFKVGDHVRISKYKKDTHQIGLKKFLQLKKVKNAVSWTYVVNDLNITVAH